MLELIARPDLAEMMERRLRFSKVDGSCSEKEGGQSNQNGNYLEAGKG